MVKDPASAYKPGRRGREWLKVKRALATLDVVVTAVEVGYGKRRHLLSDPGLLEGVAPVRGEALDGGDLLAHDGARGRDARARGDTVHVDGAGPALGHPATVFRARVAERVPQHPEQRRIGRHVDRPGAAVDEEGQLRHHTPPSGGRPRAPPRSGERAGNAAGTDGQSERDHGRLRDTLICRWRFLCKQ